MGRKVTQLREACQRGLRADSIPGRNAQRFETCTGLRATEYGLRPLTTVVQPISAATLTAAGITPAYPFPQLFRGKGVTLLADEDAVYTVTEGALGSWTVTPITTKDADDLHNTAPQNKSVVAGGTWHFMDFYDSWMLFNGTCQVFKMGFSDNVWVGDAVTIKTGCDFYEGRAIYGGFNAADFYPFGVSSLLEESIGSALSQRLLDLIDTVNGAGNNWVWWSTIGGGDLLYVLSMMFSKYGVLHIRLAGDPAFMDFVKMNQSSYRPMPWQGDVLRVLPLGKSVIVYGEDGISALVPGIGGDVATMALVDIKGVAPGQGIVSRSAAGGGDYGHVFVDTAGELWRIAPSLEAERLGYGEFFEDYPDSANEILVSFDSRLKEFYISDKTTYWVLTEQGLSKGLQCPTTVSFAQGEALGVLAGDSSGAELVSQEFDYGDRDVDSDYVPQIKALRLVTTMDATGWLVAVDYRFRTEDDWTRTTPVAVDGRGVARVNVSGVEFRIVCTAADATAVSLDAVEVEFGDGKRELKEWLET